MTQSDTQDATAAHQIFMLLSWDGHRLQTERERGCTHYAVHCTYTFTCTEAVISQIISMLNINLNKAQWQKVIGRWLQTIHNAVQKCDVVTTEPAPSADKGCELWLITAVVLRTANFFSVRAIVHATILVSYLVAFVALLKCFSQTHNSMRTPEVDILADS